VVEGPAGPQATGDRKEAEVEPVSPARPGIEVERVNKIREGRPLGVDAMKHRRVDLVLDPLLGKVEAAAPQERHAGSSRSAG